MLRPTHACIDMQAFKDNLTTVRNLVAPNTKCMAIIKANAYGHGILPAARAALEAGADYLGVAIIEEGAILRQAGITAPILVLGGLLPNKRMTQSKTILTLRYSQKKFFARSTQAQNA